MTISNADFDFVRALVRDVSAIVLDPGKEYLVESRLIQLVHDSGMTTIADLVDRLRRTGEPALQKSVVEAMTTNETTFFRDVAPFEALRRHVVPELLASKATGRIQIWCGACSSGQEPYSVAMALREDFPAVAEQRTSLLATDLDSSILERARRGSYSHLEVNRGLPAPFLFRFFMPRGTEWQIREEIRQAVEFRELNLIGSWPALPRMDIVFLRNVLIYFDAATKREILLRIRDVMAPRGYLFLGSTETLFNLDDKFERVEIGRAVCFRPRG